MVPIVFVALIYCSVHVLQTVETATKGVSLGCQRDLFISDQSEPMSALGTTSSRATDAFQVIWTQ